MYRIETANIEGDIHCKQPWHHADFDEYKFNMDSEVEMADDIKDLDWDETHRQWDDEYESWVLDLGSIWYVMEELSEKGYTVTVENDVLKAYREEILGAKDTGGSTSNGI